MTLVTTPSSTTSVHWRQADAGIFVATADGEYAGFVARSTAGYAATGPLGEDLGHFTSAGLAMMKVEDTRGCDRTRAISSRSRRPFAHFTRPLRTRRNGTHGR